ncbi:hypothetical protein LPJ56_005939, partial [Coemansia sp. RSA 2599]
MDEYVIDASDRHGDSTGTLRSTPGATQRALADKDSSETLRRHSPKMHAGRKTAAANEKTARRRPGPSYLQAQVVHYRPRV